MLDLAKPYEKISCANHTVVYAKLRPEGVYATLLPFTGAIVKTSIDPFEEECFVVDEKKLDLKSLTEIHAKYSEEWFESRALFRVATRWSYASDTPLYNTVDTFNGEIPPPPELKGIYLQDGHVYFDMGGTYARNAESMTYDMFYYFVYVELSEEDSKRLKDIDISSIHWIENEQVALQLRK